MTEKQHLNHKNLLLFDIDGTLIESGNHYKESFCEAIEEVLNLSIDYDHADYEGYTELQFIHEMLNKYKIKKDQKLIKHLMKTIELKFSAKKLNNIKTLNGVPNVLIKLKKNNILGLVTGNREEIANIKLKFFKLDTYFTIGAYGDKFTDRSKIVGYAIEKAKKKYNNITSVYVIGDTVKDIQAAKKAGVKSIAVATGVYSYNQLKKENPDYVFHDINPILKVIK